VVSIPTCRDTSAPSPSSLTQSGEGRQLGPEAAWLQAPSTAPPLLLVARLQDPAGRRVARLQPGASIGGPQPAPARKPHPGKLQEAPEEGVARRLCGKAPDLCPASRVQAGRPADGRRGRRCWTSSRKKPSYRMEGGQGGIWRGEWSARSTMELRIDWELGRATGPQRLNLTIRGGSRRVKAAGAMKGRKG
jgi:hypothetical protein